MNNFKIIFVILAFFYEQIKILLTVASCKITVCDDILS